MLHSKTQDWKGQIIWPKIWSGSRNKVTTYELPEPKAHCKTYSLYLKDIAENDPPAFICHFYNIYFGHSAGGGRMIGSKVIKKNTIH